MNKEETLFNEALALPPSERAGYLDQVCGTNHEQRRRIESRLIASSETISFDPSNNEPIRPHSIRYFGDYEILGEIARGAMGVVYRAEQKSLKRKVALKMIRSSVLADDAEIRRFRLEAEAAAALDHPGIVPIYEIGEHEGHNYFSMKLIEGGTLNDHLERLNESPEATASFMAKVARAVDAAHQRGILHRDLKPGNILVSADGYPHITDFGLAKQIGTVTAFTLSGQIMGTPGYMSPEQAAGNPQAVSRASDIYSLGAILYQILTGRLPHIGTSLVDTLHRIVEEETQQPRTLKPEVDPDLATIAMRCLQKRPEERYQSASELADELDRRRQGVPIRARPIGVGERLLKWMRRKPVHSAFIGTAALLLITLGVGGPFAILRQSHLFHLANERGAIIDRNRYLDEIRLAAQYVNEPGGTGPADELLEHWIPKNGGPDPRRWEWYLLRSFIRQDLYTLQHSWAVGSVSWHPGSTHLASTTQDSITIWDASNGGVTLDIPIDGGDVFPGAHWSPDGTRLATCGSSIVLWSSVTGEKAASMRGSWEYATDVCWSPDGTRLASANSDNTISVWERESGDELLNFSAESNFLRSVCWSPDGQRLASDSSDEVIRVWDAGSGESILAIGPTRADRITWAPDGKTIAAINGYGAVSIRDASTGEEVATIKEQDSLFHSQLSWSPEGFGIAMPSEHHTVDIASTSTIAVIRKLRGHSESIYSVAWSPDGTRLASASADQTVKVWDLRRLPSRTRRRWDDDFSQSFVNSRGQVQFLSGKDSPYQNTKTRVLDEWPGKVDAQAWHPDGIHLAAASTDHVITIWNASSGEIVHTFEGHAAPVRSLCYSSSGSHLASGDDDGEVRVWSPDEEGMEILRDEDGGVKEVTWSPGGDRLAASFSDHTTIWNLDDIGSSRRLRENIIAWCPDGRCYAVASSGGNEIQLSSCQTDEHLLSMNGHTDHINSMAWSPDGARLASGSDDTTVRIWEPLSGRQILTLGGSGGAVESVRWSSDGKVLATSVSKVGVRYWDATTGYNQEVRRVNDAGITIEHSPSGNPVIPHDPTIASKPVFPLNPFERTYPRFPLGPFEPSQERMDPFDPPGLRLHRPATNNKDPFSR